MCTPTVICLQNDEIEIGHLTEEVERGPILVTKHLVKFTESTQQTAIKNMRFLCWRLIVTLTNPAGSGGGAIYNIVMIWIQEQPAICIFTTSCVMQARNLGLSNSHMYANVPTSDMYLIICPRVCAHKSPKSCAQECRNSANTDLHHLTQNNIYENNKIVPWVWMWAVHNESFYTL